MILKALTIGLIEYGENKGKYAGSAKFQNDDGAVEIKLTPAHCEQIFAICADGILSTAKAAAANLTCSVIEHRKSIGK